MKFAKFLTCFLPVVLLLNQVIAQPGISVILQPVTIPGLPGLQSFAAAQFDGKWVIIGGRTEGLHQRQPFSSFLSTYNNTNIYVVDPVTLQVWSSSVTNLPFPLNEQLQSTNMCFTEKADRMYIVGGYGYSASINNHKTYNSFIDINLPGLINAIINGSTIAPFFRRIDNDFFAVTGGQLGKIGDFFMLVGGQRFDGRYNPNNGPSFTQAYTDQIRKFKIYDDGTNISITQQSVITDINQLHRRDYNMAPQVFPDGSLGYPLFLVFFSYRPISLS